MGGGARGGRLQFGRRPLSPACSLTLLGTLKPSEELRVRNPLRCSNLASWGHKLRRHGGLPPPHGQVLSGSWGEWTARARGCCEFLLEVNESFWKLSARSPGNVPLALISETRASQKSTTRCPAWVCGRLALGIYCWNGEESGWKHRDGACDFPARLPGAPGKP